MLCRFACLLFLPFFSLATVPPAVQSSEGGALDGLLTFKATRLDRAFRVGSEAARLAELALAKTAIRDPKLPQTLADVVGLDIRRKRLARSTLIATELFCNLNMDQLRDQQIEFATSPATPIAVVAASTLADRAVPNTLPALKALSKRREFSISFGMRRSIVDGVANYKEPAAIDFLIDVHKQHPGQLRFEVTKHLMQMTGENHGGYSDRWEEWWKANGGKFDFAAVKPLTNFKDAPWPEKVPRFFDLPLHAYRVVFVIDRSRSMLSTTDGVTRMNDVQEEIERVLREMRPEIYFNVIAYSKGLTLWKRKLVPATLENRLAATKFSWKLSPLTTTSLYDAVDRALDESPDLELVVVLTDGKPTSGKVIDQSAIVKLLTEKNKFHEVSITAIGLDLNDQERQFLKKLTDDNFGELWELR